MSGSLEEVSADSVIVSSEGARRDFSRQAIVRLEKLERMRRRSALKGLAIGGVRSIDGAVERLQGWSDFL